MMVYFRKRLPESVVNDCNERIVLHGLRVIRSSPADHHDDDDSSHGNEIAAATDQQIESETTRPNQGSLLIDAMHLQVRECFGHKPRTHRKQARKQFLAVAKKKRPRIHMIRKAMKHQLGHLNRNLASIDALIACGASLLAAGREAYQKLMVVSERFRQQNILYHSETRSIPDRIVSLCKAQIRPIVRGKARCNVEFGALARWASACGRSRSPSLEKDSPFLIG